MQSHVTQRPALLRRALLALIVGSSLFTPAEQLRANHNAHECQDTARLARWVKNTRRVAAERQQAQNAATLAGMQQGIERFEARLKRKARATREAAAVVEYIRCAATGQRVLRQPGQAGITLRRIWVN